MKITYVAHACFVVEAQEGTLVMDPFIAAMPYRFPRVSAGVVTVSHEHDDHNAVARVSGNPVVVRGAGTHRVGKLEIVGIASWHDDAGGSKRGTNTIFTFAAEGLRLAHLGDLGTPLDAAQRTALHHAQVLFVPVGGYYTIDAATAAQVVRGLPNARIVVPMHYRTELLADWPTAPVDDFLRTMDNPRHIGSSSVVLTRATLPEALEVWVFDHA